MASHEATIFLSYTLPPSAIPGGYEKWLRDVDNPFFNAIPGVGRYENWEVAEARSAPLSFTHFDFMTLGREADLERVWFNKDLDEFRKGWIRKWGYGATGTTPPPAHAYGYLARGIAAPNAARQPWCAIIGGETVHGADESWAIVEAVRKHYAIGPAPAGEAWHRPLKPGEGPGLRTFNVVFAASEQAAREAAKRVPGASPILIARLMAAPGFKGA
jgi:hypothetical protein